MPRVASAGCIALTLLAVGCQSGGPDTRAADERTLSETDAEWAKVAGTRDVERFAAYYAPEASVLAPNAPIATGAEAIKKTLAPLMALPNFALTWKATAVKVARSGDLGYTLGTYEMSFTDPGGKPVQDRGKYLTVWQKQADGRWKAAADMFNTDLPAPGGGGH